MQNLNSKFKRKLNYCQSHTGQSFQEEATQLSLLPNPPKPGIQIKNNPFQCSQCGSENLKSGAGKKPGQESIRCGDCGEFLGYSPIKRLKRLRKRKNLTDSINFLESRGIVSEAAQIFLLSEVGAIGGGEQ